MFFTKSGRPITYHGNEHIPEPRRKDGTAGKIRSMDTLFEVLLEVWCKNTAYPGCRASYDQENDPTYGQCAITAMLVYDTFGGSICKIKTAGGGSHYFNRIDGCTMDLTSDQFALYNMPVDYSSGEAVSWEHCGRNADTQARYELLARLVNQRLWQREKTP